MGVDNTGGAGRVNAEMLTLQVDSLTASGYADGRDANAGGTSAPAGVGVFR